MRILEGSETVGNDELIRKRDAIKEICEDIEWLESQGCTEIPLTERKERDVDIIEKLPSASDKLIQIIEEGIKATGIADEYSVGMCNGMKWCKSLLDGKEPVYDTVQPTHMRSIGKLIGYTGKPCPNCGRLRVERYESGLEICEKCNWCEQTKSYWLDWEER